MLRTFPRTYSYEHSPELLPREVFAVLSMHKLTVGDGYAYLTRHVAAGDAGLSAGDSLTAYYEQTGNPQGRWMGDGLNALGDGRLVVGAAVSETAMTAVFRDGRDPLTFEPLGTPFKQVVPGEGRHTVAGYDLTFTAPKSASILWGWPTTRRGPLSTTPTAPRWPRPSVTWRAKVFFEHRVIAEKSFQRKTDARRWEADQLVKLQRGTWIDPTRGRVSFGTLAEEWQSSTQHLAVRSQETTQFLLDSYVIPLLGRFPIAVVSATDVERVLTAMTVRGLATATRRRVLSVIRLVLDYAVRDRRISVNVARSIPLPKGTTKREPH